MCNLCGKESDSKVDCWWFNGTEMNDFTVYLCSEHANVYEFLYEFDTNNPDPSSYANLLLGMARVGPLEKLEFKHSLARGAIPWKEGDELPEAVIRRMRNA